MPITNEAKKYIEKLRLVPNRFDILDKVIKRAVEEYKRQAVICKITKKGIPIFESVYGKDTKNPELKFDTIYSVMSVTKPVVAALILCLQEDGEIDLIDPVYKYLPELKKEGYKDIKIWQCATHVSGINDAENEKFFNEYVKNNLNIELLCDRSTDNEFPSVCEVDNFYNEIEEKMRLELDEEYKIHDVHYHVSIENPLTNEPGEIMSYSNMGYEILKKIICKVTGKTIDEYSKMRLFDPLNMVDTMWVLPKEKWNRVIGRSEKALFHGWLNHPKKFIEQSGAGGLKSTVNDILKFCNMILNSGIYNNVQIMSKANIKQMFKNYNIDTQNIYTKSFRTNEMSKWSIGWNLQGQKKDNSGMLRSENNIEHGGLGGTLIMIDPDEEIALALFAVEEIDYDVNINSRIINTLFSAFY